MSLPSTIWATAPVYRDGKLVLWLRYNSGHFELASMEMRNSKMTAMTLSPEAMEALVSAWPEFQRLVTT